MTRIIDGLVIEEQDQIQKTISKHLWSYSRKSFLQLILLRNRGYFSRKIFNILYEILEVSFIAYFCHPEFYTALLFIPFSSFFMNLILEELFNLNRAAMFNGEVFSEKLNQKILQVAFAGFSLSAFVVASGVIFQHWLLIGLFLLRFGLIALQSYSFGASIDVVISRRIYFPQSIWLKAFGIAVSGCLLAGLFLKAEVAVALGICLIYVTRSSIELIFLKRLREDQAWQSHPVARPRYSVANILRRFSIFGLIMATLVFYAMIFSGERTSYFWVNFFLLVFFYRLLNRPFRGIQIDLHHYQKQDAIDWLRLRLKQLTFLSILVSTGILLWSLWKETDANYLPIACFYLSTVTLCFYLALNSIGQEIKLFNTFFFQRLLILGLLICKADLKLIALTELILSAYFFIHFFLRSDFLKVHVKTQEKSPLPAEVFNQLVQHEGEFLIASFHDKVRPNEQKFASYGSVFKLTRERWILPKKDDQVIQQLWQSYPRMLRQVKVLSRKELSSFLKPKTLKDGPLSTLRHLQKHSDTWCENGKKIDSPETLKIIAIIEKRIRRSASIQDLSFSHHFDGQFYFPVIELNEVKAIFIGAQYDQHLVEDLKGKAWHFLSSSFSRSS